MQVISAKSPKRTSTGSIDMLVTFSELGEVPFTSTTQDEYGLFTRAESGEFGTITNYVVDLVALKATKKSQIELERDVQIAQDVTVHGRPWDADKRSQENLSNEILTTQTGVQMSPIWRDANNDNMTLTNVQQLIDIAAAMKTQTLTAYMTSWVRKAAVDAATTAEEVALI